MDEQPEKFFNKKQLSNSITNFNKSRYVFYYSRYLFDIENGTTQQFIIKDLSEIFNLTIEI